MELLYKIKWGVYDCRDTDDGIHVAPIDDGMEHEFTTMCDCEPTVEFEEGSMLVIHNAHSQ